MKPFYKDWVVWLLVSLAVVAFFLASKVQFFELVYDYTRQHEDWELDEFFSLTFILPIVVPLLMYRANRRLRTVIAQKHAAEQHATHLALHDVLTGLGNRRKFTQHLDALLNCPQNPSIALVLVDLDGFKAINDRYGHRVGDGLLQVVADRMNLLATGAGLCSRLGGDEFAIVIDAVGSDNLRTKGEALAAAICETARDPVLLPDLDGLELRVSASAGVAFLPPATDPSDLLRQADCAMYAAKLAGKDGWRIADLPDATTLARVS